MEFAKLYWSSLEFVGVCWSLLEFVGVCWSLLESVGVRVSCNLWLMCVMLQDRGALVLFQVDCHELEAGVVYQQLGVASVGTVLRINRLHARYCSPLLSRSIR